MPGHLVPDYPKALHNGWKGIQEEAQAVLNAPASTAEQHDLACAIIICADAVNLFMERYLTKVSSLVENEPDLSRRAELEGWLPFLELLDCICSLYSSNP